MHLFLKLLPWLMNAAQIASVGFVVYQHRKIRRAYHEELERREAMAKAMMDTFGQVIARQAAALVEAGLHPFGDPETGRPRMDA